VIVSFHGGSPLNRIGGLDSNESGLNRRINLQLLSGHPQHWCPKLLLIKLNR
jgi:hypothetical protein